MREHSWLFVMLAIGFAPAIFDLLAVSLCLFVLYGCFWAWWKLWYIHTEHYHRSTHTYEDHKREREAHHREMKTHDQRTK